MDRVEQWVIDKLNRYYFVGTTRSERLERYDTADLIVDAVVEICRRESDVNMPLDITQEHTALYITRQLKGALDKEISEQYEEAFSIFFQIRENQKPL